MLYITYTMLIFGLHIFASVLRYLSNKYNKENTIPGIIDTQIRESLLMVLGVSCLYMCVSSFIREVSVEENCHLALWLWIAQSARLGGYYLGELLGMYSLSYWAKSI